jgi:3-oxoacyl-[acyl-carrier protein] reductase
VPRENIRFDFRGRTAIVTGAGQGIGRAIALAFAKAGASVATADIDANSAHAVLAEIEATGGKGLALRVDVSDAKSVEEMVAETERFFGGVDILVNNAAIAHRGDIFTLSENGWDRLMAINLKGVWLCSREALKAMMKKKGEWPGENGGQPVDVPRGRIVNIGSISGWLGGHEVGADYAVSKAGVAVLTKRMANKMAAHGITVNSVAPHAIETPITEDLCEEGKKRIAAKNPVGRFGLPEEVVAAVLFLASEEAAYVTGQTVHVNGGTLMVY